MTGGANWWKRTALGALGVLVLVLVYSCLWLPMREGQAAAVYLNQCIAAGVCPTPQQLQQRLTPQPAPTAAPTANATPSAPVAGASAAPAAPPTTAPHQP